MKFLSSKRQVFSPEKYNPAPGEYDVTRTMNKRCFATETGKAGNKATARTHHTERKTLTHPGPGAYYKKKPFGTLPTTKHNNMFEKVQQKFNHDMP